MLLSSSVFTSYSMTVYAADDYDLLDGLQDICLIVLGVAAVLCPPAELTAIGFVSILSGVLGAVDGTINIYDYVTDNGDGTYTIDQAFIQAVLDAAEQLEAQGFTDKDITTQNTGRYSIHYTTFYNKFWCSKHTDTIESCKFEGLISVISGRSAIFVSGPSEPTGTYSLSIGYEYGAQYLVEYQRQTFACGYTRNDDLLGGNTYGANIPIFSDNDAYMKYLNSGTGYKDAENYRAQPLFRRHSSYTPTYSGGSVTVSRTVVQNITQKIAEVDADDTKTDDEKIEALQRYILSGGTPDIGGGGSGGGYPGDKDYVDNKDLPAGTDLTDTNSWLKKIYLKVCQIFDKMNTAVEDAGSAAMARIQESLDEIIVQLKKIKRWTAVDTVIDGVDAIADWLDLIRGVLKDAEEGAGSAVATIASAVGDSVDTMSRKFPFSIPWDILFFVSVLSAEPQVPHFEIPFNIELSMLDITIDYTMELDFTQLQWLSDLSRLLLSMTYAVGLMRMTFGVTSAGKEE